MEKNAHNFWQYTDYGVYEGEFISGGALFSEIKTDSKLYEFVGFYDQENNLVTTLPETGAGLELPYAVVTDDGDVVFDRL